jgi:hypothetical protein
VEIPGLGIELPHLRLDCHGVLRIELISPKSKTFPDSVEVMSIKVLKRYQLKDPFFFFAESCSSMTPRSGIFRWSQKNLGIREKVL